MRAVVYLALLALALGAVLTGELRVALALAGTKALLVGAEYMELRSAARLHALGFAALIAVLVLVLIVIV